MAKKTIDLNARSQNSAYTGDLSLEPTFFDPIEPSSGTGIIKRDDGLLELSGVILSPMGIQFDKSAQLSKENFITLGEMILMIHNALQWIIGDYFAYGEQNRYGSRNELAKQLNVDPDTVTNWTSVCRKIEYTRRRVDLEFGHHEAVAALTPEQQDYWLEQASIGNGLEGDKHHRWSIKMLRDRIAEWRGEIVRTEKVSRIPKLHQRFLKSFTAQQFNRMSRDEQIAFKQDLAMMLKQIDKWENS